MGLSKNLKKALFFWTVFNLIGYSCYLFDLSPSKESTSKNRFGGHVTRVDYFLVPKYERPDYYGKEALFPDCDNCNYGEKENFWPFHKFTYSVALGSVLNETVGRVGFFGYYGHYEFLVYVIIPFITLLLYYIYKKFLQ